MPIPSPIHSPTPVASPTLTTITTTTTAITPVATPITSTRSLTVSLVSHSLPEPVEGETLPKTAPLVPFTATLSIPRSTGDVELVLYDAANTVVDRVAAMVINGHTTATLKPRGRLGPQMVRVLVDGQPIGDIPIATLDAQTTIETGNRLIDLLSPTIRDFLAQDVVQYTLDGHQIRGYRSPDNPLIWLRDHVYQGRGFRYFEQDVTSALESFRRAQRPDGSFPDVLTYPMLGVEAHRLEGESDLEFLFVQGVYDSWQMTGDDAWLRENLDAMRRGLIYITNDPLRWDEGMGLVRRPYTIDTWDFQFGPTTISDDGKPAPRHWIDDQTIWGIFHGDNTGLAYALKLMERMERALGHTEEAKQWHDLREGIIDRINERSWNGQFYTHFVQLDGSLPTVPGLDTGAQLSLSNSYALNRELLTFPQGRAIIDSYYQRRNFDKAFAEWYSIDPPFPAGSFGMAGGKGERPGEYVNGGIMPLVGGELARGAFRFGAEGFGFDILQRYASLIDLTGASYLWYHPDGSPGISGEHTLATDGWGSSAMLGALFEGAAGIEDRATRYERIRLSPRWGALLSHFSPGSHTGDTSQPTTRHARVVARYPASDGYVAYEWRYEVDKQRVWLDVTGSWDEAYVRLLLPPDGKQTTDRTLLVNGEVRPVEEETIGTGQYIVFAVEGGNATIALSWQKEQKEQKEPSQGD